MPSDMVIPRYAAERTLRCAFTDAKAMSSTARTAVEVSMLRAVHRVNHASAANVAAASAAVHRLPPNASTLDEHLDKRQNSDHTPYEDQYKTHTNESHLVEHLVEPKNIGQND